MGQPIMGLIVGIVAVLAVVLLLRVAFRRWNRWIEVALEDHLRQARDHAETVSDLPIRSDLR